ncbi:dynein axonemal intermediate chain 4 [Pelobates fuscus]|uniref:dynein axonemal intermediate chain 4 n=1 Tax=Pelobates fuscus TaxID=191477 RepID=UPI002FE47106
MPFKGGMRGNKSISGFGTQSRMNYSVLNRSMMGSRKSISLNADSKIMDKNSFVNSKQAIQVYDNDGNNVTPRPLFQPEPGSLAFKHHKHFTPQDASGLVTSDIFTSISMQQTVINTSFIGPFSGSIYGDGNLSKSGREAEPQHEDFDDHVYRRHVPDAPVKQVEVPEQLGEEELNKMVDIELTETDTLWLFDMPPMLVATDSEEAESVRLRNQTYTELCKNRVGNDRYVQRMVQTIVDAPKSKEVQCEQIVLEDAGVMASAWDMYDSYNSLEEPPVKESDEENIASESITDSRGSVSRATTSYSSVDRGDINSSAVTDLEKLTVRRISPGNVNDSEEILNSEKFKQDLFFMERILVQNIFQPKLAAYRQLPVITDPEAAVEPDKAVTPVVTSPSLDRLWSFICDITKGHNVSSMSWNKKNPDLLAVGYGQFGFKEQKAGLTCCWSLKNTMWPERIFHCQSGVTAVDFSASNPNLLAVGMYDGNVAIYNVQSSSKAPILDTSENPNKHIGPVWQLKWIEQDQVTLAEDKGEILVSISEDGRIVRWHTRKGLNCNDLMKLKRTGIKKSRKATAINEKKGEALISRQAQGMCFDFLPKDSNIYLAGTEEGHIHKCSCSYNEQFLDTYQAHKGPVYKIAWSPFCPDIFLSCSADWTINLWRQDILKPILTFAATTNAVYDIMWSPVSPLVFGTVNETMVEIWDLAVSTLDPVIVSLANPGVKLTSILFAKNTDCVLIGDSDGQVSVYKLSNISSSNVPEVNALEDLIGATLASQL